MMYTMIYYPETLDGFYLERIEDTDRALRLNLSPGRQKLLASYLTDGHLCFIRFAPLFISMYTNTMRDYTSSVYPVAKAISKITGNKDNLNLRAYRKPYTIDPYPQAYPFFLYDGQLGAVQSRFEALIEKWDYEKSLLLETDSDRLRMAIVTFVVCTLLVPTSVEMRRATISTYGYFSFLRKVTVANLSLAMRWADSDKLCYGSVDGWKLTSMDDHYSYYEPGKPGTEDISALEAYQSIRATLLRPDDTLTVDRLVYEALSLVLD